MKMSEKQNYHGTWLMHYLLDPFIIMVSLGSLGHMRHMSLLYSFSYIQVFLVNVVLQHLTPILITSNIKELPSKYKVEV